MHYFFLLWWYHTACLNLGGGLKSLLLLESTHLGLGSHDATTPLSSALVVLVHEAILDGRDELGVLGLVLRSYLGQGQNSSGLRVEVLVYRVRNGKRSKIHRAVRLGQFVFRTDTNLLVDDSAETGLALDNGVGDTHLLAERGQEDDQLNGVNIVGDEDQRSLLVLNETDDVVQTILDGVRLLADVLLLLALLDGSGLLQQTLLLLGFGLGAVLVEELESLGGGVAVQDVLELGQRRGNLETHLKDLLLALKADILRPLDHTANVSLGLDVLADAIVAGTLLEKRVLQNCVKKTG